QPCEVNQRQIARKCDMLSIGHWIIRNRLPDKLTRRGIEHRVRRVLNPLEPRNIDTLEPRNLLDLAIHERSIVALGSVKQLVAFYTNRETLGHVLVVDQAVAEIENACTSAARDDLLKRIEWVECVRTQPNFGRGRPAKRRNTTGERMIGRDEKRQPTKHLERAGGRRRKFIVRFCI